MGIFDFLKKKGNSDYDLEIPNAVSKIEMTIKIFEENPNEEWSQILDFIGNKLEDETLAIKLFRFIPMAYCRMMLPEVNFPDHYVISVKGEQEERRLIESQLYMAVDSYVKSKFTRPISQEDLMSVLNHSAEFSTLNTALHAGSKLEDLVLGAPIFT